MREAGPDDLDLLVAHVVAGMGTYRDFAPAFTPPSAAQHRARTQDRMRGPGFRAALAAEDRASVALFPAFDEEPGLVHLYGLWLPRELWGSGLAATLLAWALDGAREQQGTSMRLVTPAQHGRARAFYAREGFLPAGPPGLVSSLGLVLVELRRAL